MVSIFMGAAVIAQQALPPPAMPAEDAKAIASGWSLLAEGKHAEASALSQRLLGQYPRSTAALLLAVESAIGRSGASAGQLVYERWLGARTIEEPGVLRRVARATLYEWARQSADSLARLEALKALVREGDADAAQVLLTAAGAGGVGDLRALASLGNADAIDQVVNRMKAARGLKITEINILGDSGSERAVMPLVEVLADPARENRANAAEALGRLGRAGAISHLKPLLTDPSGAVRLSAAGALFRLGDFSGEALLKGPDMAGSEHPGVRRSAAILLASRPDDAWKTLVRGLLSHPDPSFRLDAAKLLAPHEPATSRAVLDRLVADANPEIRDLAGVELAGLPETSLATLRQLLRTGAGRVKVGAADRLLALTR